MTALTVGYDKVLTWVKGYLCETGKTAVSTVGWVVLCIVVSQAVNPACLARAIPAEESGSGRTRLRRVRRWWQGPELDLGKLTPRLIKAALALLPEGQQLIIALDTSRAGDWEIWQTGVVFAGHTLPVAWAVLPYPWPKGRFREVTLSLVKELQAAVPEGWHWALVADRGFPSTDLFVQLMKRETGWTIRLRLGDWVEVAGEYTTVIQHLDAGRLVAGQEAGAIVGPRTGGKTRVKARIVVSNEVVLPPKHKRNPGTERERAQRAKKQEQHLANRGRKNTPRSEAAKRYAHTWVLFTNAETYAEAVAQYSARMAIEQTFRDWKHWWRLEAAIAVLSTDAEVCRLIAIVSLAYFLQVELGWRLSRDLECQKRRAQWTVTNRVSLFWCGQRIFDDPGYDWAGWLSAQWDQLIVPDRVPVGKDPTDEAPAEAAMADEELADVKLAA